MGEEHNSKPSVLMVLMGYNQEGTIGYAVDSALRQDYDGPLTIVLTDDCSQDGTFRIMQEKAAAYKGPHKVLLNRNEKNLGYAGNLYKAASMVDSEWVCKSDGDDYSYADRVSCHVKSVVGHPEVVIAAGRFKMHGMAKDDPVPDFAAMPQGGTGEVRLVRDEPFADFQLGGGVCMWRRWILTHIKEKFPQHQGVGEDLILAYVSRMRGTLAYMDREILCYVAHENNSTIVNTDVRGLREIYAYSVKWNRLMDESLETQDALISWLGEYLEKSPDLEPDRRAWGEMSVEELKKKRKTLETYCRYHHHNMFSNLVHWLRHRDVGFSRIFPAWLKCVFTWAAKRMPGKRH